MLTRISWWLSGTLFLIGVSISGYAYATSCIYHFTEVYDMQIISVTVDGIPQMDSPDYAQVSGELGVDACDRGCFRVQFRGSAPMNLLEKGWYYGQ